MDPARIPMTAKAAVKNERIAEKKMDSCEIFMDNQPFMNMYMCKKRVLF